MRLCKAEKSDGQLCRMWALENEEFCRWHSDSKKAYEIRTMTKWKADCLRKKNKYGRLFILNKALKNINNDKTIPAAEKGFLTIDLCSAIDRLEKELK